MVKSGREGSTVEERRSMARSMEVREWKIQGPDQTGVQNLEIWESEVKGQESIDKTMVKE